MITGDDILIEYVARLGKQLAQGNADFLKPNQVTQVEKFIIHYVWKQPDQLEPSESGGSSGARFASLANY